MESQGSRSSAGNRLDCNQRRSCSEVNFSKNLNLDNLILEIDAVVHYEYSHVVVLGLSKSKDLQSKDASNSSRIESKLASQPERWFSIQFRLFELIGLS